MHKIIMSGLLFFAMICNGAEKSSEKKLDFADAFYQLPEELQKKIREQSPQIICTSYPIERDLQENKQLLLPSSYPIHPVPYRDKSSKADDSKSAQEVSYLPQIQCWVPKYINGSLGIYLDNDEKGSSTFYNLATVGADILFDVNESGTVLFCVNESTRYRVRLAQKLEKRERLCGMKWDLIDRGHISAIALHPKENKAAFILRKDGCSGLSIFDFDTGSLGAKTALFGSYHKVTYCGNDTWAVLAQGAQLALYQQAENTLTDISVQFFSNLNVRMIGVNVNYSMIDGFKPLWALLDPGNKLWICAFSHKFRCLCKERNRSAFLAIATIPNIDCTNISYENDKISVLYRDDRESDLIIKGDVYTVDFEAIYLYKLAKHLTGLEQTENADTIL